MRDVRLVSADSVRKLSDKLRRIPAGPHRVTLMREELHAAPGGPACADGRGPTRRSTRFPPSIWDEQLRIFHEAITPADEQEERALALRYLRDRYADAFAAVDNDD